MKSSVICIGGVSWPEVAATSVSPSSEKVCTSCAASKSKSVTSSRVTQLSEAPHWHASARQPLAFEGDAHASASPSENLGDVEEYFEQSESVEQSDDSQRHPELEP